MKKILSVFLSALFIFALLGAISVSAETFSGTCGDDLVWYLDTETGELIISGTGDMQDYMIEGPEGFEKTIAPWGEYSDLIKSVEILPGVTSVGNFAFFGLSNMEYAVIPDGATVIGTSAFSNCTALERVALPGSVTELKYGAFSHCSSLDSLTLGYGLKEIGYLAFYKCTGLKSITIPGSVTTIVEGAFDSCTGLESVIMGKGVKDIGDYVFVNCSSLAHVYYKGSEEEWAGITIGGESNDPLKNAEIHFNYVPEEYHGAGGENITWIFDDETGVLTFTGTGDMIDTAVDCTAPWGHLGYDVYSVVIEDGITSVGDFAFTGMSELSEVSIPESVDYIGCEAFAYTDIKNIDLPSGIEKIEFGTFIFTDIEKLTIPDGVTTIRTLAFHGCDSLREITVPSSVKTIEDAAFMACELTDVYFGGTKAEWGAINIVDDHNDTLFYAVIHCTDGDIVPPEPGPGPEPEPGNVPAAAVPDETASAAAVPAETAPAANGGVKRDTSKQSPAMGAERENVVLPVTVFMIFVALTVAALVVAIKKLVDRK